MAIAYVSEDGKWRMSAQKENENRLATIIDLDHTPNFCREIYDNPLNMTCEKLDEICQAALSAKEPNNATV